MCRGKGKGVIKLGILTLPDVMTTSYSQEEGKYASITVGTQTSHLPESSTIIFTISLAFFETPKLQYY